MKPTKLKPGQRVIIKPEVSGGFIRQGTFIRRCPCEWQGRAG